jgi:hypothetical protein
VRGLAHGIQFRWMQKNYEGYKNECLRLFGRENNYLDTNPDEKWHPFKLQRA